ncbi:MULTISPECIES: WcbI family polysaccharide biosynthesis putative acetyltransferase [unclassified Corynebacterium]|uniref:WcbI family polysaccharide biosynthesis putative acetyltransferase n=1 Tax=unclassified Corynebacterium TaxID=2624378 RepID=UPI00265199C7|nr:MULTISPECIES: WcbI family polysaccharide biosynthesis putative acetyltransferase [unclassified Corynebacterium]MDN8594618.1 WcbI family polysaccharide biosynthesis putative acetyltransferase [Corynebacterium sp. P4_F2]WKK55540.1 WcbI family polysaccharide biosynthesis putative acetyltransferase [Corynebacterium sp. P4-C1]WKK62950.1 WcbI family polysaccharide biosynthesis putative acetyltransferase [Corynebacterium sp. P8-C1]
MPFLTVVGNCQAESLRRLISSAGDVESTRIAPVHELEPEDMEWFADMLARTDILVTQPIRDDYRGLPVGTSQTLAQLPRSARHVIVPVLRYDGLMPYQAIIRDPADSSQDPPVIPYHDLRILAAAARGLDEPVSHRPAAEAYRRAADMSVEQLRSREQRHGSVLISDYLETAPVWHTVNHPDNATLAVVASRAREALGLGGDIELPDYEMLGELDAPIDAHAASALGTSVPDRDTWTRRGGGEIPWDEIVAAQLEHYRARPELVAHGLERHAERIAALELLS